MKIIARRNTIDIDMFELYSKPMKYLICCVHHDSFFDANDRTVYDVLADLDDGMDVTLNVSVDIIPDD